MILKFPNPTHHTSKWRDIYIYIYLQILAGSCLKCFQNVHTPTHISTFGRGTETFNSVLILIVFVWFNTQEAKGTGKWFHWMTWDQASVTTENTHTPRQYHTRLWWLYFFERSLHHKHTRSSGLTCCSSSDAYSTLDQRGRRNTLDNTLEPADQDAVQVNTGHTCITLPAWISWLPYS